MAIKQVDTIKYIFSGHDSFHCRQLWLKKGYDFVQGQNNFNDDDAVVKLGVGKNMVSSIRFWLKAFNIIDQNDVPTSFGKLLFDEEVGLDPFLEDQASLWLLHYQLVRTKYASIYNMVFNEFRKEKLFFKKETFVNYIKRVGENILELRINENTVAKDFMVFVNLYKHEFDSKAIEDSFSGILSELELLKIAGVGKDEQFYIDNNERDSLPEAVVLYAIVENESYGNSISLNSLEYDLDSVGSIFALNRSGLVNKITGVVEEYDDITYTDHAGIKELQFKNKPSIRKILERHYGK
jgi:hypothetical protein